ncbi:muscle M-line assembly protein unc-89 [Scheffersomyces xylosifermentans]|uniref:muscle M-line assembly protein unc-89 n=1 Tax=Scheffersomyces xylosifermentans TaxID=1304137 RepID=UPI00315CCFEF
MTELSPSSKKVDDFLSGLSQLSQDRLREDQQRQRELQRSVDELRLKSGSVSPVKPARQELSPLPRSSSRNASPIPSLTFNRSEYKSRLDQYEEENAPKLPKRPAYLDTDDKNPPPLPTRKPDLSDSFDIELLQPTARKSKPVIPSKPSSKPSSTISSGLPDFKKKSYIDEDENKAESKYRSFTQIEDTIKNKTNVAKYDENKTTQKPTPPKPRAKPTSADSENAVESKQAPVKKDWLSSTLDNKATTNTTRTESKKPVPRPKSDWLSSTLENKATINSTHTESKKPIPRPKSDWLSSTLSNSKTTISNTSSAPTPASPPRIGRKPNGDWLSSLSNSQTNTTSISKSPSRATHLSKSPSKNANSWLDSAVSKRESHYSEEIRPSFQITKKKSPSPVVAEEETTPEYLERLEQIKKGEGLTIKKPIPKPPKPSGSKYTAEDSELLKSTMAKLSSAKTIPPKRNKTAINKYTEEDAELLKSTMAKLSTNKAPPPKPSKPSIEKYSQEEKDLLQSALSNLSPKKVPPKPSKPALNKYEAQDTELLRSQMSQLSNKSTSVKAKEKDSVAEGILARNRLKPVAPAPSSPSKTSTAPFTKPKSVVGSEATLSPAKPISFEDKLSGILRASTAPQLTSKTPTQVIRSNTDPIEKRKDTVGNEKLVHPSKGRTKGPKRKLPKSMQKNNRGAPPKSQPKIVIESAPAAEEVENEAIEIKKRPPPINKLSKPKPVEGLKPTRNFSGEIFI